MMETRQNCERDLTGLRAEMSPDEHIPAGPSISSIRFGPGSNVEESNDLAEGEV